jgi:hypothetical protein
VARFKDEVRDARGVTLADDLGRDVRFAARSFRRSPAFKASVPPRPSSRW